MSAATEFHALREAEAEREAAEGQAAMEEEAKNSPDHKVAYEDHLAATDGATFKTVVDSGRVYLDRVTVESGVRAKDPEKVEWSSGALWNVDVVAVTEVEKDGKVGDDELEDGLRRDPLPEKATLSFLGGELRCAKDRPLREELRIAWNPGFSPLIVRVDVADGRQWEAHFELPAKAPGERGRILLTSTRGPTPPGEGKPYEPHLKATNDAAWKKVDRNPRVYLGRVRTDTPAVAPDAMQWVNGATPWRLDLYAVKQGEEDGEVEANEASDGLRIDRVPKRARLTVTDLETNEILVEDRHFDAHLELSWDASVTKVQLDVATPNGRKAWSAKLALPTTAERWSADSLLMLRRVE